MQASEVCLLTGCDSSILQEWVKGRLIVPAVPARGAGNYALYDAANVVAVGAAMQLRTLGVRITHYAGVLREFDSELRKRPMLEWRSLKLAIDMRSMVLVARDAVGPNLAVCIVLDIRRLSESLVPLGSDQQISLNFGDPTGV